jgi:hypothetical protein
MKAIARATLFFSPLLFCVSVVFWINDGFTGTDRFFPVLLLALCLMGLAVLALRMAYESGQRKPWEMLSLAIDLEIKEPSLLLNLICVVSPILTYLLFMNIFGRLLSFAIIGPWVLYIYSIPVMAICALVISLRKRNTRRVRVAALCFFIGQCALAAYIYNDLLNSP